MPGGLRLKFCDKAGVSSSANDNSRMKLAPDNRRLLPVGIWVYERDSSRSVLTVCRENLSDVEWIMRDMCRRVAKEPLTPWTYAKKRWVKFLQEAASCTAWSVPGKINRPHRNLKLPYSYLQKPFLNDKFVQIPWNTQTKRTSEPKITLFLPTKKAHKTHLAT